MIAVLVRYGLGTKKEASVTYAVDFERYYDKGDFRYWLRRTRDGTVAVRQPFYSPKLLDHSSGETSVDPRDLPDDLKAPFNILCAGGIPAVDA